MVIALPVIVALSLIVGALIFITTNNIVITFILTPIVFFILIFSGFVKNKNELKAI